jgi:hypothetical protein
MDYNIQDHANSADIGWGNTYYGIVSKIINENQFRYFAEIGVAFGGHLEEILNNTKIELAYAIDSYLLSNTTTDSFKKLNGIPFNQSDYESLFQFAKNRLQKFENRIKFIRENSTNSLSIIDHKLDMVFIDAEHSYDAVYQDTRNWIHKIKKGGILSGHDYDHPNFLGVKKAVDEFIKEFNLELNVERGYVWWTRV